MQTISALFDTHEDAIAALKELRSAGVPESDISLMASGTNNREFVSGEHSDMTGAETGASLGAILAGGAGLLAGLGMMAIPGIGPVVAAGWLASTAAGAAAGGVAGGLLGTLVGAGVDRSDAEVYAEGVKRGGTLVSARVDDVMAVRGQDLLDRAQRVDLTDRKSQYQQQGWNGFDDTLPPIGDPALRSGALR